MKEKLQRINDYEWLLPKSVRKGMRVDAKIIANKAILAAIEDEAVNQLTNVAMLPGILNPVIGLSDMHFGYGLPMGATMAFDKNEGIISSGCTGFDINCIDGDTKILHSFGYTKKIKDFEKTFQQDNIVWFNPTSKLKNTDIALFMKKKTGLKKVYKIKTEYGKEIIATEDHPFFTKNGKINVKDIKVGDQTSFYPFEGISYEIPKEFTIVDLKDIKKENSKQELIKNGLLPLKSSNLKLSYLLKLLGFLLGDGHAYRTKDGYGRLDFYSKDVDDLKEIQRDIEMLGYRGNINSRQRSHSIDTFYGNVKFDTIENTLRVNMQSLFDILEALGLVLGNKVHNKFRIPDYLFKLALWQKRLFLASFFGAELSSPKTVTNHGYNFYGLVLSLNKSEKLLKNIDFFLKQIKLMLNDFGIESNIIKIRKEYEGKKGITYRTRLQISSKPDNLINFFSKLGYEYNKEKKFLSNIATAYLLTKKKIYLEREEAIDKVNELKKLKKPKEIFKELVSEHVNKRFLIRTLYEKRKDIRISFNFLKFEDFLKEKINNLGKTGQVWAKIVEKEEIDFDDLVYDFTVFDENHNFIANNFVVSNCGINSIRTNLDYNDIKDKIKELTLELFRTIPCGVGSKGKLKLTPDQLDEVLVKGVNWAVENNYGTKEDIKHIEEDGCMEGGDPNKVSDLAKRRGLSQLGTLGAGNHFLEVQKVSDIFDEKYAKKLGIINTNQVLIMVHCGSRGLGHQVASDYLKIHEKAIEKYGIKIPDKQLVGAPANSEEGQDFFSAMKCAVNYSFTNRLVMTQWIREAFERVLKKKWEEMEMQTVYSIAHNITKLEKHKIDGKEKEIYITRKGSTRAFPDTPVLIAGTMGTSSFICKGTKEALEKTFGSSVHGAGRCMSRTAAIKKFWGDEIKKELSEKGIITQSTHPKVLAEESPQSYKNVLDVVDSVHNAGISLKVCKLKPVGVCKG